MQMAGKLFYLYSFYTQMSAIVGHVSRNKEKVASQHSKCCKSTFQIYVDCQHFNNMLISGVATINRIIDYIKISCCLIFIQ